MMIEADHLGKIYNRGRVTALRDVSFGVNEGEIYGLIGPDGAGKTSLFRIMATLLLPDSGRIMLDGCDVVADYRLVRRRIGYMPGRFSLYPDLTVEENLRFFATIFGTTVAENYDLVAPIYRQIEKFKTRKAGKLSGGMKQKLALSCALIHSPRVLLLDEPTTGVDPVSRKEFWDMLQRLQRDHGLTIVASTPYMDEAVQCDRVTLMSGGRFLQTDTPQAVIDSYDKTLWAVRTDRMHPLLGDLRRWEWTDTAFSFGERYHLTVKSGAAADALYDYLSRCGHDEIHIAPIRPTIEDCFMALGDNTL